MRLLMIGQLQAFRVTMQEGADQAVRNFFFDATSASSPHADSLGRSVRPYSSLLFLLLPSASLFFCLLCLPHFFPHTCSPGDGDF
jgi:hypothetical protein